MIDLIVGGCGVVDVGDCLVDGDDVVVVCVGWCCWGVDFEVGIG